MAEMTPEERAQRIASAFYRDPDDDMQACLQRHISMLAEGIRAAVQAEREEKDRLRKLLEDVRDKLLKTDDPRNGNIAAKIDYELNFSAAAIRAREQDPPSG